MSPVEMVNIFELLYQQDGETYTDYPGHRQEELKQGY